MFRSIFFAGSLSILVLACAHAPTVTEAGPAPIFDNLGSHHRAVTTHEILAGDMAARRGQVDDAVKHLEAAAKAEDDLNYDEPPDWILPARHILGRVLLDAGRAADAEAVYRKDLERNPENAWSLVGLSQALQPRKPDEAKAVAQRAQAALCGADVKVVASCF
jgi:tetratricopeptide (TPR) repeat protein